MREVFDVAVVGGGVIGRSVAFELARRRHGRIALIDDGARGGEASPAAAAFLPVASMRAPRGILFDLGRASLAEFPAFLDAVGESSGVQVPFSEIGCLQLAETAEQAEALRERVLRRHDQGFEAMLVDADRLADAVPGVGSGFAAGAIFPRESRVDAAMFLAALAKAGAQLGVTTRRGRARLRMQTPAVEVEVAGVVVIAAAVIVCAGWWSAEILSDLGVYLPVRPARGETLELEVAALPPYAVDHEVLLLPGSKTAQGYLLRIGGAVEMDSSPAPTPRLRDRLLARAARVWPATAGARVVNHWAGVRPCSDARHPIVDHVPGLPGVLVATGHHRSGFLLAPITARVVAARLAGEALPVEERAMRW